MATDETPLDDLGALSPDVAAVLFATEWDDAFIFYRTVAEAAGLSHEEFVAMLDKDKAILTEYVPLPGDMTVETSKPYVSISDMLTLARLARYCFEHIDDLPLPLGKG